MIALTLILAVLFLPYFAPTVIALVRSHHQRWAILALNLFLGWTFIGWVIALVWSLTSTVRPIDARHLNETFR